MARVPFVSVIVPAYLSSTTIRASLEALGRQSFRDFEVIVVDSSPDDRTEQIVRADFPAVLYSRPRERLLPHQARNQGAHMAGGQVFAFTDPDCVADPDWLATLMTHHRSGPLMAGGAIRSLPGWWNRSVHAARYGWWLVDSEAGVRPEVPSANSSLARGVWERLRGFRGEYFAGDSELCWRVRELGYPIVFEPRAIVTHLEHPGPMPFARERFARGRDFGRMRIELRGWSRLRCFERLLAAPLALCAMTWRSARYAPRDGHLLEWLPTLPVQVVGNGLWCAGEASVLARAIVTR